MISALPHTRLSRAARVLAAVLAVLPLAAGPAIAQNAPLRQRFAEIQQTVAANRQALARYTWQARQTMSINGKVKKLEVFQVRFGPDGPQQRTLLSSNPPAAGAGGPTGQRIVDRKTIEDEQYGEQISVLAQTYAQPDPQRLQQSYQQGHVTLGSTNVPGDVTLTIASYLKPNDSVTVTFTPTRKMLQSLQISTYLSDPTDAVKISVLFGNLADGTTYASSVTVHGVSKQVSVQVQTGMYEKIVTSCCG